MFYNILFFYLHQINAKKDCSKSNFTLFGRPKNTTDKGKDARNDTGNANKKIEKIHELQKWWWQRKKNRKESINKYNFFLIYN